MKSHFINCNNLMKLRCIFQVVFILLGILLVKGERRENCLPSETLPILYINIYQIDENGEYVKDSEGNYVFDDDLLDYDYQEKDKRKGVYWLDINDCVWALEKGLESIGSKENPLGLQINLRGNFTRIGFVKKPYKIKLDKKANLMGLTPAKSKHYALLAHADDKWGYMRNFVAFNLGERIGLPWTPKQLPIELVINDDYRGLYFITESVKVGEGRIDIEELDDKEEDLSLITGGYVLEIDNNPEDVSHQISIEEKYCSDGHLYPMMRFTFESPEEYSDIQRQFVSEQINTMNDLIGENNDNIWSYIDLDDAVRYYLIEEIIHHREAYNGSTFIYRNRGENQKWHFSPLWDQGLAFNQMQEKFFYDCDPYGNHWITSFRENQKFNQKINETWLWFMSTCYDGLEDDINEYINQIRDAIPYEYERWKDTGVPPSTSSTTREVVDNREIDTIKEEVIGKLNYKINWLKTQFGDFTTEIYNEPEKDDTPFALLPEWITNSITEIEINNSKDYQMEYFDLSGRHIFMPIKTGIYITIVRYKKS